MSKAMHLPEFLTRAPSQYVRNVTDCIVSTIMLAEHAIWCPLQSICIYLISPVRRLTLLDAYKRPEGLFIPGILTTFSSLNVPQRPLLI
eukprot:2198205-Pyramimonas_sp.AAC.1